MNNRLNEIRKQIMDLRVEMAALENQIRLQVSHDMECSEVSLRLIAMRQDLVGLIRERDALGGAEIGPTLAERLAVNRRGSGVPAQRLSRRT